MYIRNIKEKKMELRQQNREFRRSLSAETKSVLDRAILKKFFPFGNMSRQMLFIRMLAKPRKRTLLR
jgi:hypothetical protein